MIGAAPGCPAKSTLCTRVDDAGEGVLPDPEEDGLAGVMTAVDDGLAVTFVTPGTVAVGDGATVIGGGVYGAAVG